MRALIAGCLVAALAGASAAAADGRSPGDGRDRLGIPSSKPVPVAHAAGRGIVVRGRLVRVNRRTRTLTYRSAKGTYSATWLGPRRYRLRGRIRGRRLVGTIRTRQVRGHRYRARGSGRLGGRRVRIGGGGPNSLRRATLVLR